MDNNFCWIDNPCFKSKDASDGLNKRQAIIDKMDPTGNLMNICTLNDHLQPAPKIYIERGNREIIGNIPDPNKGNPDFIGNILEPNKGKPDFFACIPDPNRGNRHLSGSILNPYSFFDSLTKNSVFLKRSSKGNSRKFRLGTRTKYLQNKRPSIKFKNCRAMAGPSSIGRIKPNSDSPPLTFHKMSLETCGQFIYKIENCMRKTSGSHIIFLQYWIVWVEAYENIGLCNEALGTSALSSIPDHE